MSDAFDIGKIDPLKSSFDSPAISPQAFTQQAAWARVSEGGAPAPSAPPPAAAPASDAIRLSHEANEASSTGGAANLLAAWGAPQSAPAKIPDDSNLIGGFNLQSGPPPGLQAGGIFGANGLSGVAPGMQAGAVYSTPPLRLG